MTAHGPIGPARIGFGATIVSVAVSGAVWVAWLIFDVSFVTKISLREIPDLHPKFRKSFSTV